MIAFQDLEKRDLENWSSHKTCVEKYATLALTKKKREENPDLSVVLCSYFTYFIVSLYSNLQLCVFSQS